MTQAETQMGMEGVGFALVLNHGAKRGCFIWLSVITIDPLTVGKVRYFECT